MKRLGVLLFLCLFLSVGTNVRKTSAVPFSWQDVDTDVNAHWIEEPFEGRAERDQWCNVDSSTPDHHEFTNDYSDRAGGDHGADEPNAAPIPEPTTILLFGAGLLGYAGARRKKQT